MPRKRYITVCAEVDVDIDLDEYKDEIEEALEQQATDFWGNLVKLYRFKGAAALKEHIEQELNERSCLQISL